MKTDSVHMPTSQSTGKLDPGTRGARRVVGVLDCGRCELQLLPGCCPGGMNGLPRRDNEDLENTTTDQAGPSFRADEDVRASGEAVLATEGEAVLATGGEATS
ncbi:hypothetical protein PYW07_009131 [Mythimna separata]|uniref:Uncharacterized protein n=1 Tax=Mythimna separata TaxID=271217 RepID=A0AAD7YBN0_MYTSE|nr:hypothetical protein PYW07_013500 [Mythimna separata]KAJ8708899.1 hypothetical protein PYW07_013503 [Mythimna separata]KAJ8709305.1 hypothetical protein PYW07_009131 [Mythimna separata]